MIIVKTNTGTHFINEKQIKQVWHDKENAKVFGTNIDGTVGSIDQVDAVTFVSDAKAMEFHDDGNVIGTMIHGILDENPVLVENLKNQIDWMIKN